MSINRTERWVARDYQVRRKNRTGRQLPLPLTLNNDPLVDNTATIQNAIDALANGIAGAPATLLLPAGRYRVDGVITIASRSYLRIDGGGVFTGYTDLTGVQVGIVTAQGTSNRAHWRVSGSNNVTLSGINIDGVHRNARDVEYGTFGLYLEATAFEHGFAIQTGSTNCSVLDCHVNGCGGDAYYVGGTDAPNTNITIKRCSGMYPGRQSIGVVLVDGLLMEDITIHRGGRSGLDIEPNHSTHFVHNATFRRMDIGSKFYPYIVGGVVPLQGNEQKAGIVNKRENILIEDCVAKYSASSHTGILANRSGVGLTVRNHVDRRQRSTDGMNVTQWTNVNVNNCEVSSGPSTPLSFGVRFTDCVGPLSIINSEFNGIVSNGGADRLYGIGTNLDAGAAIGATTVVTKGAVPVGTVVSIDSAQIRTVTATAGAGPYTLTLSAALTFAVSAGDPVIAEPGHEWVAVTHSGNNWNMGTGTD